MKVTSASLPDIGRSLRVAREQLHLSLGEAAERAGVARAEAEAFESGTVSRLPNRVETLRGLRTYAESFGLPGKDYVLVLVDLWPTVEAHRNGDAAHQIVSVTTAVLGGHAPAIGTGFPAAATGASDFSVTGVTSPLGNLPLADGAPISPEETATNGAVTNGVALTVHDTGEIPRVRARLSRGKKWLLTLSALVVALGIFTLTEHSHFSAWSHTLQADAKRWTHDLKVDVGITPRTKATTTVTAPGALPKVDILSDPASSHVTFNVHASEFNIKMVAFKASSWMQVTDSHQQAPIFQAVVPSGGYEVFPVSGSVTVETGSASARAYLYSGASFIGYFFPTKAPYTLTFNAVG